MDGVSDGVIVGGDVVGGGDVVDKFGDGTEPLEVCFPGLSEEQAERFAENPGLGDYYDHVMLAFGKYIPGHQAGRCKICEADPKDRELMERGELKAGLLILNTLRAKVG